MAAAGRLLQPRPAGAGPQAGSGAATCRLGRRGAASRSSRTTLLALVLATATLLQQPALLRSQPAFEAEGRNLTSRLACESGSPPEVARRLLAYWLDSVQPDALGGGGASAGGSGSSQADDVGDVEAVLARQKVLSHKDYCMFKMRYTAATRTFDYEKRAKHCEELGIRWGRVCGAVWQGSAGWTHWRGWPPCPLGVWVPRVAGRAV